MFPNEWGKSGGNSSQWHLLCSLQIEKINRCIPRDLMVPRSIMSMWKLELAFMANRNDALIRTRTIAVALVHGKIYIIYLLVAEERRLFPFKIIFPLYLFKFPSVHCDICRTMGGSLRNFIQILKGDKPAECSAEGLPAGIYDDLALRVCLPSKEELLPFLDQASIIHQSINHSLFYQNLE